MLRPRRGRAGWWFLQNCAERLFYKLLLEKREKEAILLLSSGAIDPSSEDNLFLKAAAQLNLEDAVKAILKDARVNIRRGGVSAFLLAKVQHNKKVLKILYDMDPEYFNKLFPTDVQAWGLSKED